MPDSTPRIYVACLAAYNAGTLHGRWIDATQDADDIRAEIAEMLEASPEPGAEEYAIHDYDNFDGLSLGEYESIDRIAEIAQAIEEHGPAVSAFLSLGVTDDVSEFGGAYCGEWDSEKAFAEDNVAELGIGGLSSIPDELWPYLDMDSIARDLFMGDYSSVTSPTYTVYVFRQNW